MTLDGALFNPFFPMNPLIRFPFLPGYFSCSIQILPVVSVRS